jgi:hypothetical protein
MGISCLFENATKSVDGGPSDRTRRIDTNSGSYCGIEITAGIYFLSKAKIGSVNEPSFLSP